MIMDFLKRTQNWGTKLILIVLAIAFAFGFGFSLSNLKGSGRVSKGVAAKVNDQSIPLTDFYRVRDLLLKRQRLAGLPEKAINKDYIGIQVLNQLIDTKLLAQEAHRLGMRVSDEELSDSITAIPVFQNGGRFVGGDAYKQIIEGGLNETVIEFERNYREELLSGKMRDLINLSVVISDEELLSIYKMRREKVNLNYIEFEPASFKKDVKPTEEEIEGYYKEHKGEFLSPELRSIKYFTLGQRYFEGRVSVSKDEVRAYYEANRDKAQVGGKEKGAAVTALSDDVAAGIRTKLLALRAKEYREEYLSNLKRSLSGKTLDELARGSSVSKLSESSPFAAGESPSGIPREVVSEAFRLKKGGISTAVVGDAVWFFGVKDVIAPAPYGLDEVREDISAKLIGIKAKELAESRAKEALAEAARRDKPLIKIAAALGGKVNETGYFARVGRITRVDSDEMKMDAFQLTPDSPVASKVYSVGDSFYVVELQDRRPVDMKEFYAKREELRESELNLRRRRVYSDWIRWLRTRSKITVDQSLFASNR